MLDCAESNRPRHWSGLSCSRQPNNRVIFYDPYSGFLSDPCAHGFPTNACGATHLLAIRYLQLWCQPMGPLCLWQCLLPVRDPNLWYLIFFVTCSRTGEAERNLASEHLGCRQPSSPFPFLQITFNSVCGNLLNLVLCQRFKTLSNSIRL